MNWRDCISLGIVHPQLFPETARGETRVLETLSLLVEDGFFDTLEITAIKDRAERENARNLLQKHEVRVVYCCAPPILINRINLNSLQEDERLKNVELIKGYLLEAVFMNAEIFTVLSGPDPGPMRRAEAKEYLVNSLKDICRFASVVADGLTITLESFDCDVDKRCLIGPTADALEIAREVVGSGCQNFGLTLDQGHLPLLNEEPAYAISRALPFLSHLHLGNCIKDKSDHPLYGDHHPRYGLDGCCLNLEDLSSFLHVLDINGYWGEKQSEGNKPVISFEVKPAFGESSWDTLQLVKDAWIYAWENFIKQKEMYKHRKA